ncbi:hypothetical protein AFLA70_340g000890, partial [Aspergillus flavus AF70]
MHFLVYRSSTGAAFFKDFIEVLLQQCGL